MDIGAVKWMVHDKEGIPPDQQQVLLHGRLFEDGDNLSDHSISTEDTVTVYLLLRLRGGMYHFTSGRQDLSSLPGITATAVKRILAIKFNDVKESQQSPSELQNSLIQAQRIFAILYREIADHTTQ